MNIRFDIRHLKAFMAVSEHLHFKNAADSLFITQPALSRLIKSLEDEVGTSLFSRNTRNVELTKSGYFLLQECKNAFEHIERGIRVSRRASEGDIGSITLAYNDISINGKLPNIIESFKDRYPEITVELIHVPSQSQPKAILDGEVDIGFLIGDTHQKNLNTKLISQEKAIVILPEKHPLADRSVISVRELSEEKFVVGMESSWQAFRDQIFGFCQKAGFTPKVIQEASTASGIFGLVAANVGISIYSECVYNFNRVSLKAVPLSEQDQLIEIVAAWSNSYQSASSKLFIEHLNNVITSL